MTINERNSKLKEQDMIIRAQIKKIGLLEGDFNAQKHTIAEYEARFVQVRDAITMEKQDSARQIESLQIDLAAYQERSAKVD